MNIYSYHESRPLHLVMWKKIMRGRAAHFATAVFFSTWARPNCSVQHRKLACATLTLLNLIGDADQLCSQFWAQPPNKRAAMELGGEENGRSV